MKEGLINILTNIGVLHTFAGGPRRKELLKETNPISPGAVAWSEDGTILATGAPAELAKKYKYDDVVWHDAGGRVVTPGLIDSHTHAIHAGGRAGEFVLRCQGADYMKILAAGGGILNSAENTRKASLGELVEIGRTAFDLSLSFGVTTIEGKSGYGLTKDSEIKLLKAMAALRRTHEIRVKSTFMGAHAVPAEFRDNPDSYIDLIINEMIPEVASQNLASYCDVFIEEGIFSVDQAERILKTAINHGMKPKAHCDEMNAIGATEMAIDLGALSVDHLIVITDSGIEKLAASDTVGCLLPGTSFFLKKPYAPARRMIDAGCLLALASDNNPGSSRTENIQWILTVACLYYGLTPEEAFSMVTINAAAALGVQNELGSIEPGKKADLVVWDSADLAEIPYHHGVNHAVEVIIDGQWARGKGRGLA